MAKLGGKGNGPKSWNGAKRRLKRPESKEAKLALEQEVGKLIRKKRRVLTHKEVMGRPRRNCAA